MIDSHCHLADEVFHDDLEAVVARARAAGVDAALCVLDATNEAETRRAARVGAVWPAVRFAVGVHPHQAGQFAGRVEEVESYLRGAIDRRSGTCAIGEIGLDYHYDYAPRDVQRQVFRSQIRVARDLGYPIVIHMREADDDTFAILAEGGELPGAGVFHCFTGDVETARRAVDLGFYVSFSGIVTFRAAESVRASAAVIPDDRLLIETDAPYLAPVPHRGKQNEPAWVGLVADMVAGVRGVTSEEIRRQTDTAFTTLFRSGSAC